MNILIAHYKTGKMTAYTVAKIKRHSPDARIIIIDNSLGEGLEYVDLDGVTVLTYPSDRMQSHGLAFDYAIPHIDSDYFITLESDAFPTHNNWLDYYHDLIHKGYDMAGSRLQLSGGNYIHPAGAMYKVSNWKEAKHDVMQYDYDYYPNMIMSEGFPHHCMIKKGHLPKGELHPSYAGGIESQRESYRPIAESVFHQGMGSNQESFSSYGRRNVTTGVQDMNAPISTQILRMGYEPGQWFGYWHLANDKKVFEVPTQVEWMPNRTGQQQEYTISQFGVKHLWGVTSYGLADAKEIADITARKQHLMNELYNEITSN